VIKKFIILAIVAALIGVGTGIYLWHMPAKKVENSIGISVSTDTLANQYARDEKKADAMYLNKAIKVSGIVSEVDKNQDGGLMIILQTSDPMAGVQCALRDKGANPIKGQNIVIKGFCSGNGITGVSLTDCIITSK
jgi:hypothetical protein